MTAAEFLAVSKRLADVATPGPWEAQGSHVEGRKDVVAVVATLSSAGTDAEFIAHARTALPKMREALEAVLAMHSERRYATVPSFCNACPGEDWPCVTVTAIESALAEESE